MRTPAGLTLVGDEIDGDARLRNVRVYRNDDRRRDERPDRAERSGEALRRRARSSKA